VKRPRGCIHDNGSERSVLKLLIFSFLYKLSGHGQPLLAPKLFVAKLLTRFIIMAWSIT
jgi:hypothetical protein